MSASWWDTYAQQVEYGGASDLPHRLPQDVQALLEEWNLHTFDPAA